MCSILALTTSSNIDKRLQTMTTLIVEYGAERFGVLEYREKPAFTRNRRATQIKKLRGELRSLKKQFKKASAEELQPLSELREALRAKLKTIRRAERIRKRRKERSKTRARFIANPFGFAKKLLGDKRSGSLECGIEEVNTYLLNTFSDPEKDVNLGMNKALIAPEPPTTEFVTKPPTLKEITDVVKAGRSASAPGPSGVPYIVYKRCPGLLRALWKIIKAIWRRGRVADQWRRAEGVWIPKQEN